MNYINLEFKERVTLLLKKCKEDQKLKEIVSRVDAAFIKSYELKLRYDENSTEENEKEMLIAHRKYNIEFDKLTAYGDDVWQLYVSPIQRAKIK